LRRALCCFKNFKPRESQFLNRKKREKRRKKHNRRGEKIETENSRSRTFRPMLTGRTIARELKKQRLSL